MSNIENVMGFWKEGILTEAEVIIWADQQILKEDDPSEAMMDLSLKGPAFCSKRPSYEFPAARNFSFSEAFALRASKLDVENITEVERFIVWLSRACLGEDLATPEVTFGYNVEHYTFACNDWPLAIEYLKDNIQELLPKCRKLAISLGVERLTKR